MYRATLFLLVSKALGSSRTQFLDFDSVAAPFG
jgi:hypothetical protein